MTAREGHSAPIARAVTSSVQNDRCDKENCPSAKRRELAIFNRERSRPGTISTELSVQDWSRVLRRRRERQARPSCRPCRSATIAQDPRLHILDPDDMALDQPLVAALAVPAHPHRWHSSGSIHCGGGARAGGGIHHHPVKAAVPRLRNWPPMMTRWISEVPSQMRSTRTSRFSRSTAFSRI
jgi:hypothetical protein